MESREDNRTSRTSFGFDVRGDLKNNAERDDAVAMSWPQCYRMASVLVTNSMQ